MYDYRQDLLNIIENIDDSDEGLIRGRETLRAAMSLIDALPLDGGQRTRHHYTIRRHSHPHHQHSTSNEAQSQETKQPLNGDQYEALNKLRGIRQSISKVQDGQDADKLAARYQQIVAKLSDSDKSVLASQLQAINRELDRLGLNHKAAKASSAPTNAVVGQPSRPAHNSSEQDSPAITDKEESSKPAKPRAPFSSQKRQYVVQRELTGATLLTDNGQDAGHISESVVRRYNLVSGTIVKADIMPNDIFVHKALRHIDHLGKTQFDDDDRIDTFEFGVVKKHKHHLRVTYNSNNEPLLVNGHKHAFLLDLDNPLVGPGAIVELAWYKDDPDSMRIRWTYPTEKLEKGQPQHKTASNEKDDNADKEASQSLTKRYTNLDLHGQTVAVLVGNRQEHQSYERMVDLYNGQPTVVDSFKTKKSYLKDKLKSADIVILVKSKAHHGASKAVAEFQDQYGFAFAVADTLAMGQFEDALYRASQGLPADVASIDNKR